MAAEAVRTLKPRVDLPSFLPWFLYEIHDSIYWPKIVQIALKHDVRMEGSARNGLVNILTRETLGSKFPTNSYVTYYVWVTFDLISVPTKKTMGEKHPRYQYGRIVGTWDTLKWKTDTTSVTHQSN